MHAALQQAGYVLVQGSVEPSKAACELRSRIEQIIANVGKVCSMEVAAYAAANLVANVVNNEGLRRADIE